MKGRKITLLVVLLLSVGPAVKAQLRVVAALCDNRANPVGINPRDLFFSWEMQSSREAVLQSAYQLVIASSQANLTAGKFDVFNTDVVKSDQSIQVHYAGKALQPFTRYFWRVEVWDKDGKSSTSAVACFETGMMNSRNWQGAWISDRNDVDLKPAPYFRKTFKTAKTIKSARAYVAAGGLYELYLNGQKVGYNANSRNGAEFDITPFLKKGASNTLAVEVYRYCAGSYMEDQDMWRLSGIFRNVTLWSAPLVHVRDF
ncbi:MAG: hypothetical protein EOO39_42415, partial [Cytophagaceae bacterium]